MNRTMIRAALAAPALFAATAAFAHITFETAKAPAGSTYKAVLRVPHGCGDSPTVAVSIEMPDGVLQARPMPKPGWALKTVVKPLDTPYESHGTKITEGVREISWSGGNLPDAFYDEFVFQAKLPDKPGTTIYFPVVQECAKGVERWIEIPAAGKHADDYEHPAPGVTLGPKKSGDH
jgi:periplasmic copper chaperone A